MRHCSRGLFSCGECRELIRKLREEFQHGIAMGRWEGFDSLRERLEQHYQICQQKGDDMPPSRR